MPRFSKFVEVATLTALVSPISGCIIWPNYCVERNGVKSWIIDADTGIPIKGATIHDNIDSKRTCTSDELGSFELKPTYHWHGGYEVVALGLKILPLTHDIILPSFAIKVDAQGYDTAEFKIVSYNLKSGRVESPDDSLEADFDGTYFTISKCALKKCQPTTTQRAIQVGDAGSS